MGAPASRGQDAGSRPASALVSYYCAFACPLATRNERAKLHPASLPGFYFPSGAKRSRIRIYPCVRSFATKDYNVAYTAQRGRSTRHNKQASVFLLLLFLSSLPPIRFFLFFFLFRFFFVYVRLDSTIAGPNRSPNECDLFRCILTFYTQLQFPRRQMSVPQQSARLRSAEHMFFVQLPSRADIHAEPKRASELFDARFKIAIEKKSKDGASFFSFF